jgi:hypothetical protein
METKHYFEDQRELGMTLAREVIDAAYKLYLAGAADDLPECRDLVIAERWPCHGTGGVAMAQRRTVREVRAAIREFYAPPDHCPEPSAE